MAPWQVGDRVQAFMGEGGPYNATVAAVHGEGTDDMEYTVDWDDGDPNGRRQPAVNVSARCRVGGGAKARDRSHVRRGARVDNSEEDPGLEEMIHGQDTEIEAKKTGWKKRKNSRAHDHWTKEQVINNLRTIKCTKGRSARELDIIAQYLTGFDRSIVNMRGFCRALSKLKAESVAQLEDEVERIYNSRDCSKSDLCYYRAMAYARREVPREVQDLAAAPAAAPAAVAQPAPQQTMEELVGCDVEIFWDSDKEWYSGTVQSLTVDGTHVIDYEDGSNVTHDMSKMQYRVRARPAIPQGGQRSGPSESVTDAPTAAEAAAVKSTSAPLAPKIGAAKKKARESESATEPTHSASVEDGEDSGRVEERGAALEIDGEAEAASEHKQAESEAGGEQA